MQRIPLVGLVCASILLFGSQEGWADTSGVNVEDGKLIVVGKILAPDGSPAAGATVAALGDRGGLESKTTANTQGEFALRGVFGNGLRLHAKSVDGRLQSTRVIASPDARLAAAETIELRLEPSVSHNVLVVSNDGPAEGVRVLASGLGFEIGDVTNSRGEVELRLPSAQPLKEIVVWHPRLGVGGERDLDDEPATASTVISLHTPAEHQVEVLDDQGAPISDLEIAVNFGLKDTGRIAIANMEVANVRTNHQGIARVPWAPRDTLKYVDARPVSGAWMVYADDDEVTPQGISRILVRRQEFERPVKGRLIMPDGVSAAGVLMEGTSTGPGNRFAIHYARAASDGTFALHVPVALATGLGIADRQWASEFWTGIVRENEEAKPAEIAIEAYPASPATINVTRGSIRQPVPDTWIQISRRKDFTYLFEGEEQRVFTRVSAWLRTDSNGVAIAGLGRGNNRLRLSSGTWKEEQSIEVNSARPLEVTFHRPWIGKRRVEGRLIHDGQAYRPSEELRTLAWSVYSPYLPISYEPEIRKDGTFVVELDADNLSLLLIDPPSKLSGAVNLGADAGAVTIEMRPTASYSATVVDESEQPLSGGEVRLITYASRMDVVPPAPIDQAGGFEFSVVPSGLPLEVQLTEPGNRYLSSQRKFFEPGENRIDNKLSALARGSRPPVVPPTAPLAQQIKQVCRDAELTGMRTLVIIEGDESDTVADLSERVLDQDIIEQIVPYVTLRLAASRLNEAAGHFEEEGWVRPAAGELALITLDGAGLKLAAGRFRGADLAHSTEEVRRWLTDHTPPKRNALVRLAEAKRDAAGTGRRIWIVVGGPRCVPCFLLARWIDDHRELLEKDYVVIKVMAGLDDHADEVIGEFRRASGGIPWHAIAEPDGIVLITSEGPLGNIGFPSGRVVESLRHWRIMLETTAQRLTGREIDMLCERDSNR